MHQVHETKRISTVFATNLRQARSYAGLTQRAFAERLGDAGLPLDPSAVTRMETGERDARVAELVIIARVLGTTVGELVGEDLDAESRLRSLQRRLDHTTDALRAPMQAAARAASDLQVLIDGQPVLQLEVKGTVAAPKPAPEFLPWLTEHVYSRVPAGDDTPDASDPGELLPFAIAIVTGLLRSSSTIQEA